MQLAILGYHASGNLGDAVQSYAILKLIGELLGEDKSVTVVDRDDIGAFAPSEQTLLVMSGWLLHRPDCFFLSPNVAPVMVGVHVDPSESYYSRYPPFADVVRECPTVQTVFERAAPVGTRDLYTLALLQDLGIDSYFAGCPTMTLRPKGLTSDGSVLAVDVPRSVCQALEKRLGRPITRVSNRTESSWMSTSELCRDAEPYLERLERADLLITTNLHAAMPARALGVRTVFAPGDLSDPRFSGLADFLPVIVPLSRLAGSPISLFEGAQWVPARDIFEQGQKFRDAVATALNPDLLRDYADKSDPERRLTELEHAALVYDRVLLRQRLRAVKATRLWRYSAGLRRLGGRLAATRLR